MEIAMVANEQFKFAVLEEYRNGRKTWKEAAIRLDKSQRTVDRMLKKIVDKGIVAVKHWNYKRFANNKTSEEVRGR